MNKRTCCSTFCWRRFCAIWSRSCL